MYIAVDQCIISQRKLQTFLRCGSRSPDEGLTEVKEELKGVSSLTVVLSCKATAHAIGRMIWNFTLATKQTCPRTTLL